MRVPAFVLVAAVLLCGCISFPQSATEFRSTAAGSRVFHTQESLRSSYERIAGNSIRCHQRDGSQMTAIGGAFFDLPTGNTRIKGEIDETRHKALITVQFSNLSTGGVLQVIDLQGVSEHSTQVVVHRLNDSKKWKTATAAVESWFSGGSDCYEML